MQEDLRVDVKAHQRKLDQDLSALSGQVRAVVDLRARLARGEEPPLRDLASVAPPPGLVLALGEPGVDVDRLVVAMPSRDRIALVGEIADRARQSVSFVSVD